MVIIIAQAKNVYNNLMCKNATNDAQKNVEKVNKSQNNRIKTLAK